MKFKDFTQEKDVHTMTYKAIWEEKNSGRK